MKRTLLAMALLLTSVFGVTGCGSDDDVDVEGRVKNVAPEASGVSDAPSLADCQSLGAKVGDLYEDLRDLGNDRDHMGKESVYFYEILRRLNSLDRLDRIDLLDFGKFIFRLSDSGYIDFGETLKLSNLQDLIDVRDLLDSDMRDRLDLYDSDWSEGLDQCAAAFPEGPDSVTTTTVPYADDVSPCPEGREVENSEECLD